MNGRMVLSVLVVTAATGLLFAPAAAVRFAEERGDFYYDAAGRLVGMRHVELPEGFERRPMSFREKHEVRGIRLPDPPGQLQPRHVAPKPDRVDDREGLERDNVVVKFVEGIRVRLRSGKLVSSDASLSEFDAILARYPEAELIRMFTAEERILDEDRETGERISGVELADLNNYYMLRFPEPGPRGVALANEVLGLDVVETCYLQARGEPPVCADIAPTTPLWEANQFQLNAAPDGVDAWAARAYHVGGDGPGPSFWVCDLEWSWCLGHEDLDIDVSDVINGFTPAGNPDEELRALNHGTAVLGIYGACDNNYGMTGIAPDVSLKMADFDSEPSRASNIATATTALYPGEIMLLEIHIPGPVTGTTCPCNCDQFEAVPVEWDQASFDAISVATANGLVVVEAAGNGSVDLDWPVYGGLFDRTVRDSHAIMVGAADPLGHVPSCFTNHGNRVDVHGWGSGVFTTGGGSHYDQFGCEQDYANDFGGTSSASPVIVGACIALQGIAIEKYGYALSPLQMRDQLLVGATPQAPPILTHIGPMPDLLDAINGLEPDVVPYQAPGWSYPVVPRTANDATISYVPLGTGALPGNVAGTYWNWTMRNQSVLSPTVDGPSAVVTRDDLGIWQFAYDLGPGLWTGAINTGGPDIVKGGRHTIVNLSDWYSVEDESNEANNAFARQYIWSGYPIAIDETMIRTSDPVATSFGYGPYFNADGLRGTTGSHYWYAFAVIPTSASDDFDIRLNVEAPMNIPQQGFGDYVAYSSFGPGLSDFVVFDLNEQPSGVYWASVLNWSGQAADVRLVQFVDDEGSLDEPGTHGPFTLGPWEIVSLHEVLLTSGPDYRVHVDWLDGDANVGLSVFDTEGGFFAKSGTLPGGFADNTGPHGDEHVIVSPATLGYYGAAVWKTGSTDLNKSLSYNLIVSVDPNLVATTPPGWYGPIVPRNTRDATTTWAPLPDSLLGNQTTTSYNFSTYNEGANEAPVPGDGSWETRLFVDDVFYWYGPEVAPLAAGQSAQWLNTVQNLDPWSLVRGGRHHIRTDADALDEVLEVFETDNMFVEWFVWTPLPLSDQVPVTREAPPKVDPLGFGPYPSCDGFSAPLPPSAYWTAVGVLPADPADDYDILLHSHSGGSKDGFGPNLAWSGMGSGQSDFVIVNRNASQWLPMDFGVLNHNDGAGDFVIQRADGHFALSVTPGTHSIGPTTIDADDVLDFHEILIDDSATGMPIWITLDVLAGQANLGLAIYDGQTADFSRAQSLANSDGAGDGQDEHLPALTFSSSGFHGIAVYKHDSSDLDRENEYRIVVSTEVLVDAPAVDAPPPAFTLLAPRPNPFREGTVVRYEVPAGGGDVSIEVYDLAGRRVVSLVDEDRPAGRHVVTWNGRDQTGRPIVAGVYFLRMESPTVRETRKVVLLQ